ncbi:MAG: DUF533 domain-containing protein [Hyphomicrobiales bacterium]|nr:MAG: DUF533 domain-containing protein [Hyphomicrobiales bacterium]
MFDARSILDSIIKSAGGQEADAPPRSRGRSSGELGELGDLLKGIAGGDDAAPAPGGRRPMPQAQPREQEDAEPEDEAPVSRRRSARPAPEETDDEPAPPRSRRRAAPKEDDEADQAGPSGGGLEDIIRDVLGGKGGSLGDILEKVQKGGGLGGLGDILGPVLGQVLGGGKAGPSRIAGDAAGGAPLGAGALGDLANKSPEEVLAAIKEFMARNQFATGAAAGGLGALILGTRTGRSLASSAAKLGGLAVIGGLAYKAYQNYQQGGSATAASAPQPLLAPPAGSGFEPETVTHDSAVTMIRAMVAAAAADGRIDASEEQKIVAGLGGASMPEAARAFLAKEIAAPASVEEIAAAVGSEEEAVQVYTAARITVDPAIEEEHAFLAALAQALGIDESLAAHIDSAARSAAA